MELKNLPFFTVVHDYTQIYLPKQRKLSPNTIRSYKRTLTDLVDYIKETNQIPLYCVNFEHLTVERIMSFMDHLKNDNNCVASTCNTRLAAIRAFMDYAAGRDISLVAAWKAIRKISFERCSDATVVEHMSMKAVTAIIKQTDTQTTKGRRDRVFIILLYDTGARVQEMLDIRLCDFQFSAASTVKLHGKGQKTRIVPLMERTVQHLHSYLTEYHNGELLSSEAPLFYSIRKGNKSKLTDRLIRYMLQKYGDMAREVCAEVPENVHPHIFRHSRAMHLYQEGMDLRLISQWLGHSQLETTQIYAYADTEHKRKAIEAATPVGSPLRALLNPARFTLSDEETLKRLAGLYG